MSLKERLRAGGQVGVRAGGHAGLRAGGQAGAPRTGVLRGDTGAPVRAVLPAAAHHGAEPRARGARAGRARGADGRARRRRRRARARRGGWAGGRARSAAAAARRHARAARPQVLPGGGLAARPASVAAAAPVASLAASLVAGTGHAGTPMGHAWKRHWLACACSARITPYTRLQAACAAKHVAVGERGRRPRPVWGAGSRRWPSACRRSWRSLGGWRGAGGWRTARRPRRPPAAPRGRRRAACGRWRCSSRSTRTCCAAPPPCWTSSAAPRLPQAALRASRPCLPRALPVGRCVGLRAPAFTLRHPVL
jgi:hypothetical protein